MIKVENLKKAYGGKSVLNGLTLNVEKGEICALTGVHGAGKTTAMDIIAGATQADGGIVEIDGVCLDSEISAARQKIGYVPSKPPVYQDMTPRAYLKFLADARGYSGREAAEMIDHAFELMNLQDVSDKPVKRLAKGVRRMVSMAQAVFFGPSALLIDEPSDELDPKEILTLRNALAELAKGRAVLLASGNLTEIETLADRILVMDQGRIVGECGRHELQNLYVMTDVMTVVTRSPREEVEKAVAKEKGLSIMDVSNCADGLCVRVKMQGDGRAQLFRALNGLEVLEMTAARRRPDELMEYLVSERFDGSRLERFEGGNA